MSWLIAIQIYLLVALAIAGTSYFLLYRPSISLFKELADKEKTIYGGLTGFVIWMMVATVFAPWAGLLLLKNNNEGIIEQFALNLVHREIDE